MTAFGIADEEFEGGKCCPKNKKAFPSERQPALVEIDKNSIQDALTQEEAQMVF